MLARLALALIAATTIATGSICGARADQVSQQQEAKRAPLRADYVKAKQAEKDALDQRQAVLDRMSALLKAGNRELEQIQKDITTTTAKLEGKRQERNLAAKAVDIALGRNGRDANHPAVKEANVRLDALDAEIVVLQKELAGYQQAERDKVALPGADSVYEELLKAGVELDKTQQEVVRTLAIYLAALRPEPPPYLQAVQVYVGGKAMYRAEWRIDDKAADTATRELIERLEKITADIDRAIREMQEMRNEFRDRRIDLLGPMIRYDGDINLAAIDIRFAGIMVVLGPAVIEAVGVVLEVVLSGGASTVERHAVEEAVKAGTTLAGALTKKQTGKVLTLAERALVAHADKVVDEAIDQTLGLLQTKLAKEHADVMMDWWGKDLINKLGLKPGLSAGTKIVVSDVMEQAVGRTTKAGVAIFGYKTVTSLATASADNLTKWQAVRSGTVNFFTAKTPINRIKDGFWGSRSANVLGLCITAAKSVTAAYYGAKLGEAEEKYIEGIVNFDFAYHGYYTLLQADRILAEKQRDLQELFFQTFAYRLQTAGPRVLAVLANEGNNDPSETLTFALHFSQPLDHPPQVRIAGLVIDMKPQGADGNGRATHWEGQLAAKKLPDTINEGVLDVRPGMGSTPYADLDAKPATAARFIVPDDLTKELPNREEWSDYDRGSDRNHRIAFIPPKGRQPAPWLDRSSCDKVNCDCGHVPSETMRNICTSIEKGLLADCASQGQTYGICPGGASGPAAYPAPRVR